MKNNQIRLAERPEGLPDDSTWQKLTEEVPELKEGEFLTKINYISLDPAMRGWIKDARSYIPPVEIGAVMRAGTIGEVLDSKHPKFNKGDLVSGWMGVQEYAVSDGKNAFKVDTHGLPQEKFISVLGMPGFTAYFGLLEVGEAKEGETVVVSGAAGAVGSVVGQIAKIKGCRVIGIAGGEKKCNYIVEELGFDGAIDYKKEGLRNELKKLCPQGVDVYFDNVGGEILDTVLTRINKKARVVICGAISQYNNTTPVKGPSNYLSLLVNRGRMEGFIVFDYAKDYMKAALEMGSWMAAGKLKSKEHVVEGIDNFPSALLRLFSGDKMGKLVLKI